MEVSESSKRRKLEEGAGSVDAKVPRTIDDLATPCYIGYLPVVQRNCERMLQRAHSLGCQLRPHMKTHKTIQGGILATGGSKRCITVSTLAEAEFYADAGFEDICYAVPITADKLPQAAALTKRCTFHVCIDHPAALEALRHYGARSQLRWSVFLMVDCGYGRDGIDPSDASSLELAKAVAESSETSLAGLYTHGGHSYDQGKEAVSTIALQEAEAVVKFAERLRADPYQLKVPVVGVGSTPTCSNPPNVLPNVTEMHPGNYIYYDTMQEALGSCSEDDIAVRVLMRVIGAYPKKNLLLVDMGWTACSKQGEAHHFGRIEGYSDKLMIVNLKQEAGLITSRDGSALNFNDFPLGTLLRLEPYHSCAHTKQHDKIHILGSDRSTVLETWPICHGW